MPTVAELTDELRRLGGSGYSGKKKAELEVMLADLKKFLASKKAPAPAAEAPKPKAAEAAPAPLSAHAESMAKKAKPAKTGAVSTPLSALSAGPAKKSLAEEKAGLQKEILEFEGKIKKYESKKEKAEKRIKEIDESIKAKEGPKAPIGEREALKTKMLGKIETLKQKALTMAKEGASRESLENFLDDYIIPEISIYTAEFESSGSGVAGTMIREIGIAVRDAMKEAHAKKPSKEIPSELADKMRKDPFLKKAYNDSVGGLIGEIEDVMNGKGNFQQSITREYHADKAYELGEFYSMKWPRNANNVSIPKATQKLISQIPGHKYELAIYDTGDTEAYGRYNDVVMVLLESK